MSSITKTNLILGVGGHASVVCEQLDIQGIEIVAWVGPKSQVVQRQALKKLQYFGDDDDVLTQFSPSDCLLVNGVGSLPRNSLRQDIYIKFKKLGYGFLTVVSPSAIVSPSVELSEGVQIMPGAIVNAGAKIGENTIINSGAIIEHDSDVGSNCHIAPGVTLSGGVSIENNVHIGTGASIIHELKVGSGAVIGAGSSVTKNVGANEVVYPFRGTNKKTVQ